MKTLTGLNAEIALVARKIRSEAARSNPRWTRPDVEQAVKELRRYAIVLKKIYIADCNREVTVAERQTERYVEAKALAVCHQLGVTCTWGDPRGAPIQIRCHPSNSNGFGGAIIIPYAPANDYRKSKCEVPEWLRWPG